MGHTKDSMCKTDQPPWQLTLNSKTTQLVLVEDAPRLVMTKTETIHGTIQ